MKYVYMSYGKVRNRYRNRNKIIHFKIFITPLIFRKIHVNISPLRYKRIKKKNTVDQFFGKDMG